MAYRIETPFMTIALQIFHQLGRVYGFHNGVLVEVNHCCLLHQISETFFLTGIKGDCFRSLGDDLLR